MGYSPRGQKESDTTGRHFPFTWPESEQGGGGHPGWPEALADWLV